MEFDEFQYHKRVFTFSYSYVTSPIWDVIAERDSNQPPVVTEGSLQLTQKCVYHFRFIRLAAHLRYHFSDIANISFRKEETENQILFHQSQDQGSRQGRKEEAAVPLPGVTGPSNLDKSVFTFSDLFASPPIRDIIFLISPMSLLGRKRHNTQCVFHPKHIKCYCSKLRIRQARKRQDTRCLFHTKHITFYRSNIRITESGKQGRKRQRPHCRV